MVTVQQTVLRHFKEPLDRVLDRLGSEFRENITFYKDLSEFNEDEILREVYAYITERRCNNSTVDMFLNAFTRIYNTKVVIHNSGIDVANTAIGFNFENTIHLFKNADHFNADHFDLMELPEKNVTSQNSGDVGEDVTLINGGQECYLLVLKVILFTYKNGYTLSALIFARI